MCQHHNSGSSTMSEKSSSSCTISNRACSIHEMSSTASSSLVPDTNNLSQSDSLCSKYTSNINTLKNGGFAKNSLQKLFNIPPCLWVLIAYINYTNPDFIIAEVIFIMGHLACDYFSEDDGTDSSSSLLLGEVASYELQSSYSSELLTPASFIPVDEGCEVGEWGHFTDFDESPSFPTETQNLSATFNPLETSILRRRRA